MKFSHQHLLLTEGDDGATSSNWTEKSDDDDDDHAENIDLVLAEFDFDSDAVFKFKRMLASTTTTNIMTIPCLWCFSHHVPDHVCLYLSDSIFAVLSSQLRLLECAITSHQPHTRGSAICVAKSNINRMVFPLSLCCVPIHGKVLCD